MSQNIASHHEDISNYLKYDLGQYHFFLKVNIILYGVELQNLVK